MSPTQRSRGGRFNCVQPSSAVLTVFAAPRLHNVGGLTQLLKAKGLASSVDGSIDEFTRSFVVLTAYIGLTPQGLQRWPEVVSALFSYLALLREDARRTEPAAIRSADAGTPLPMPTRYSRVV